MWYAVGERPSPTPPHYHPTDGKEDGDVRRGAHMLCMTADTRGDNKAGMLGVWGRYPTRVYTAAAFKYTVYTEYSALNQIQ